MNGVDGLDYMNASANANGTGELSLTFVSGTNEDIAQVNVQNNLAQVTSRLPASVNQNGITVSKRSSNFLMVVALQRDANAHISVREMNDYAQRNIVPELQRIDGVGGVRLFGSESSMRIWLNPENCAVTISPPMTSPAPSPHKTGKSRPAASAPCPPCPVRPSPPLSTSPASSPTSPNLKTSC